MKLLIDTNVILDVLCNRPEFVYDASKVFKFCEVKKVDGYICALSIPNIVYIMRKELDSEKNGGGGCSCRPRDAHYRLSGRPVRGPVVAGSGVHRR